MEKLTRNNGPFLDTKKKIYVSQYSVISCGCLNLKTKFFGMASLMVVATGFCR